MAKATKKSVTGKTVTGKKARIDSLAPRAADPNQVEVRVGGRTVATLLRHRADELGLAEGAAWTPALAARVDAAAAEALAREAALAFLAKRAWSAAGLQARLVKGGHAARAAANAVKELVADGWLNDRAFAEGRVEQLRTRGAMAAEALEALLEADGVGERDAREAAKAGAGTAAELRKEAKAARKAGESANRVAGRMGRRGFDPDTIRDALEHAGYRLDD